MEASSLSLIPPGSGGVRDYASKLDRPLGAPIQELNADTDTSKWSGDMLLLHFSGYGYQKRGIPLWLLDEMKRLRARFRVFGIVFHELFASGPPWGSAFWLGGIQRRIARELLGQADFWLTNRELSAQWLREHSPAVPHRVLPVFSNVGEPVAINDERDAAVVVFGSEAIRAPAYAWRDGEIFRFAKRRGLRIHDIGKPIQKTSLASKLAEEGVVSHGMLPSEEVSKVLAGAQYGVLAYPSDYVGKSSVFAAYAAHGVCPILLWRDLTARDGMQPNVEYASGFEAMDGLRGVDAWLIGRSARRWYESHSLEAHVAAIQEMCSKVRA